MPKDDRPVSVRIEDALRRAAEPPTIDAICRKVFGRAGSEERAVVYVAIHRMIERGVAKKNEATFVWTGPDDKKTPRRRVFVRG